MRFSAKPAEDSFCLFIVGCRFNSYWKIIQNLKVVIAMWMVLKDLSKNPYGCLNYEVSWNFRTVTVITYWDSLESLVRYGNAKRPVHSKKEKEYSSITSTGIWHETYIINPGTFESLYVNMPKYGLTKAFQDVNIQPSTTMKGRFYENGRISKEF